MTRTKVTKTIAIVLAMCLAFALMSVTLLNQAKAESPITGSEATYKVEVPEEYTGAPDVKVTLEFPKEEETATIPKEELAENVKLYVDEKKEQEVKLTDLELNVEEFAPEKIVFTVPLSTVKTLDTGKTYYLVISDKVTKTKNHNGEEIVTPVAVKAAKDEEKAAPAEEKPAAETDNKQSDDKAAANANANANANTNTNNNARTTVKTNSLRTTQRTFTTRTLRTVTTAYTRVKPANTDDPSHLPLWIALAILAAGGSAIVYVWGKQE